MEKAEFVNMAVSLRDGAEMIFGAPLPADFAAQYAHAIAKGMGKSFLDLTDKERQEAYPVRETDEGYVCGDWATKLSGKDKEGGAVVTELHAPLRR